MRAFTTLVWFSSITATPSILASTRMLQEGSSVRRGDHFEVVCHFEDDAVAEEALASVEALWPLTMELYGLKKKKMKELLPVHLYRTGEDYDRAVRQLADDRYTRSRAFSDWETRTSHVALQPPLSDEALAELGLPALTRRLLIHEAAHLARFEALPNYRSHPDWLAYGAASWIDQLVMEELGEGLSPEQDPESASAMVRVSALLEREALPSAASLLSGTLEDLTFLEVYDVYSLFFRFMKEGDYAKRLNKVLGRAQKIADGPDYEERLLKDAAKLLGRNRNLDALDAAFLEYIRELKPEWEQVYRGIEVVGEEWTQIAFPENNAVVWRTTPVGESAYAVAGSLRIHPGEHGQLNLLLDRRRAGPMHDSFVSVAMRPGSVTILEYDAARLKEQWKSLGEAQIPELRAGEDVQFRVGVSSGRVEVAVAGQPVLDAITERTLDGPYGLGAQSGSAGSWKGLRLESY